jgi:hypothetical protein
MSLESVIPNRRGFASLALYESLPLVSDALTPPVADAC